MSRRPCPRPSPLEEGAPRPRFDLEFATSAAEKKWELLIRERLTEMTECWDHLSQTPSSPKPRRSGPLQGKYKPYGWWQFEVGPKQRVFYEIVDSTVRILHVYTSHPKGTE